MKGKSLLWVGALLCLALAGTPRAQAGPPAPADAGGVYQITWSNTGGGVGRFTGASFSLTGSVAPMDAAGVTTSASFRMAPNYLSVSDSVSDSGSVGGQTGRRVYLPVVMR